MYPFSSDHHRRCILFRPSFGGHTVGKRSALFCALLLCLALASSWSAHAQTCPSCGFNGCHTPATSVGPAFWGEVEPSDSGVLPSTRDSTNVDGNVNPSLVQRWISV